jgi:hypothetical protein
MMSRAVSACRFAADEKGIEIKIRQLRVVVEHFFEVRHEPLGVHGIARKAAAELVVNAAGGHALAGVQHHAQGFGIALLTACERSKGLAGLGKFGGVAETAVARVVGVFEDGGGVGENGG